MQVFLAGSDARSGVEPKPMALVDFARATLALPPGVSSPLLFNFNFSIRASTEH